MGPAELNCGSDIHGRRAWRDNSARGMKNGLHSFPKYSKDAMVSLRSPSGRCHVLVASYCDSVSWWNQCVSSDLHLGHGDIHDSITILVRIEGTVAIICALRTD